MLSFGTSKGVLQNYCIRVDVNQSLDEIKMKLGTIINDKNISREQDSPVFHGIFEQNESNLPIVKANFKKEEFKVNEIRNK